MYVITGATGNIGSRMAEELLAAGKQVRAIARHAEKLQALKEKGAEIAVGDLADTAFLSQAFKGAEAVYALVPPNYSAEDFRAYQRGIAESIASAIQLAGVKNLVSLSSIGAHLTEGAGVVQGLHDMENIFNTLEGVNVLHLRPSYFMENVFWNLDTIRNMNIMGSPIQGDVTFPMVATRDIATVGVKHLLALDFSGKSVKYVLGPRNVSYNEVARIIGAAIGKPELPYVSFPYADAKAAMMQGGMSDSVAQGLVDLSKAINEGTALNDYQRNAENTTATSMEEFAHIFAQVYNMQSTSVH